MSVSISEKKTTENDTRRSSRSVIKDFSHGVLKIKIRLSYILENLTT